MKVVQFLLTISIGIFVSVSNKIFMPIDICMYSGDNSHADNKSNSSPKRESNSLFSSMLSSLDDDLEMTLGMMG